MSDLDLYTNQAVPQKARERLAEDLKRVLPVSEVTVIHQKAEGVNSIIQVALEASEWVTPLKAAATFFLYQVGKGVASFSSQIGKRAADAAIDRWVDEDSFDQNADDARVREVAKALAEAAESTDDHTKLRIGLPIPDDFMSCCVMLDDPTEEEIALVISLFVLQAEELERTMERAEKDHNILGPVDLSLREDGRFEARWKDQEFNEHQAIIGEAT